MQETLNGLVSQMKFGCPETQVLKTRTRHAVSAVLHDLTNLVDTLSNCCSERLNLAAAEVGAIMKQGWKISSPQPRVAWEVVGFCHLGG